MNEFVKTASLFLEACAIHLDKTFFERQLTSHPDYPALTSLTDTLDELNLPYSAYLVDKDRVEELNFPALLHIEKNGKGDFEIIRDVRHLKEQAPRLLPLWDGITLTIPPGSQVRNAEYTAVIRQKRSARRKQVLFLSFILLLAAVANILHFSPWLALLSLLSVAGAFVCSLIVLHSIGKTNSLVHQLCPAKTQNGCDKVLYSKVGRLFGKTGLGDIGLIYFTGLFLFVSAMSLFGELRPALTFMLAPAGLSIPLVAYSLVYQRRVAKAWCTLCLLVAGILMLQAVVAGIGSAFTTITWSTDLLMTADVAAGAFVLAASWLFIGPLLRKSAEAESLSVRILRTKRDPDIFLLHLQRSEPVNTAPLPGDIVLGNPHSPLQITIVSNPFCNPCATAHQQLEQLLASHSGSIGLTIRFLFYPVIGITDDRRKEVVRLIHAACRQRSSFHPAEKHPVDAWFHEMNIEKFRALYQLPEEPAIPEELLQPQEDWCRKQNISFTPTIYVNGYPMPRPEYSLSDIAGLLPSLTDRLNTPSQERASLIF